MYASVYLAAAALELQVSSSKEEALRLLQTGVDNKAQPTSDLMKKIAEIKDSLHTDSNEDVVATNAASRSGKRVVAIRESSDDEDGVTEQVTTKIDLPKVPPPIEGASVSSRSSRSSSAAKTLVTGTLPSQSLGKCLRVVPPAQDDSFNMEISDDEAVTVAIKSEAIGSPKTAFKAAPKATSSSTSSSSGVLKKPDLSKFIDDKLLNFDPNSFRKKTNGITSNSSSKVEAPKAKEAKAKPKVEVAKLATASKHNAKKPRLSLSDDESSGFSFDVSVCEITRKIEQSEVATIVTQQHNSKQPTHSTFSSSEATAGKRKRVSFIRDAAAEQRPLTEAEIKEVDDSRRASSRNRGSAGSSRADSESSGASRAQAATTSDPSPQRVLINGKAYTRLGVLGKGGSSCVYRVLSEEGALYAYKRVEVRDNDDCDGVFESYINEINLLRRLKGSRHIIELIDAEVSRDENYIAMVMEMGDVDLAKNISQQQRSGGGATELNPFFVRMIWQEMLEAVNHIHENRIVHGDLKPANFVFVKGHLKLIDFGIAKAFSNDTTNIYRDSQIGTINYMAPEAIAPMTDADASVGPKMRLGKQSDIWSLGCILYQLLFGKPPFSALNTIQKLHAIPNPKFQISYPSHHDVDAVDTIKLCLERDPKKRIAIAGEGGLLASPFLKVASGGAAGVVPTAGPPPPAPSHSNDSTKSPLDGTTSHFDIPTVAIEDVKKAVDMISRVVSSRQPAALSKPHLDQLCTQVWCLLTHKPVPPLYTEKECTANQENIAPPATSANSSRQKISMKDLQGSKLAPAAVNVRPSASTSRQAMKALPDNLQQQLIRQQASLSSVVDSKRASRWMKAATTSPKQDLRSQLERKIGDIRRLLTDSGDNNNTADFTNDFNDNTMSIEMA